MSKWINYLSLLFCVTSLPLFSIEKVEEYQMAIDLREDGKTLEALNLFNIALVKYQSQKDILGVIRSIGGRLICWQHLFNRTKDRIFAILAKAEASAMWEIIEFHKLYSQEFQAHFFLGKSYVLLNDYRMAEKEYLKAVELYPLDDSRKGDWMAHLGYAVYMNGNEEKGKNTILDGIKQIQKYQEKVEPFQLDIWLTGAYLRLSELLREDNEKEGRYYLDKAEQIIQKDHKLVIRKAQAEKLEKDYEIEKK